MKETENFNIFHGFKISVSLRSIIHSYYYKDVLYNFLTSLFPSPYGVSFILIYISIAIVIYIFLIKNFRLLTEYHSFLYKWNFSKTTGKHRNFRLLTEYHSFLFKKIGVNGYNTSRFPSPYGVSFILI